MIPLRSKEELRLLRQAGSILAKVLHYLEKCVKPGITTLDLDSRAAELIYRYKALPAFKGYRGFPANICASVNDEIVHGIPGARILQEGDIVSLDVGVNFNGYFADAALTAAVGKIDVELKKLIEITRNALVLGIKQAQSGNYVSDISYAIQNYVENAGFSVVRQFVGHGIGKDLHEDPEIPNFGAPGKGDEIKPGMVFAIEPMVNLGTWDCRINDNGWTAVTKDGTPSAHFEHTVAVTERGPIILTR